MRKHDPRNAPEITCIKEVLHASDIARSLNAKLAGADIKIHGVATYGARVKNSLSYQARNSKHEEELERAVICSKEVSADVSASTKIIVNDPQKAFMSFLAKSTPDWERTVEIQAEKLCVRKGKNEIHKTAVIEKGSIIAAGVTVEPYAVIRKGVIVGENTFISSGSNLGAHGPALYKTHDGEILSWKKIHFGTVQVGNDVEIGAHSVILRGMLGSTRIRDRTVLGNIVHIGHGCDIRDRVWMAASVTICGHVFVASGVSIGAGATVRDNIDIGVNASIGMGSVVVANVNEETSVIGVPAREREKR